MFPGALKNSKMSKVSAKLNKEGQGNWPEVEGELAVDVYQTEKEVIVQSAIAGVRPEELNVSFEKDMLIIEGKREQCEKEEKEEYLFQECFWGAFSRKIILPEDVDTSRAEAIMKQGVLTIRMPKIKKRDTNKVTITEEE